MRLRLWVFAALIALIPLHGQAQRVSGEPLRVDATKQAQIAHFRAERFAALPAATLVFQPLAGERIEALRRYNQSEGVKALQIGIGRNVADEAETLLPAQLNWQAVSGGRVARVDVRSAYAMALWVGFDLSSLPQGSEIRMAGNGLPDVYAVTLDQAKQQLDGSGLFWGAVTDGETQFIELFLPTGAAEASLRIRTVSHFIASPARPSTLSKATSGACNIDVACQTATLGQAFVNAKNATARMIFTSGGNGFTCTGTLLNDSTPSTQVPYFYTAAHCVTTQPEADTVRTFWNFESTTCRGTDSGANIQVLGGANLLFANATTDVSLIQLRTTPPVGAFLAGWDAATVAANAPVIAIHHPQGDVKKYSRGVSPGYSVFADGAINDLMIRTNWIEGTTEGGSSGSGLFTLSNGQYLMRGGLAGGWAQCANSSGPDVALGNRDYYSRLDQAYPSLRQWLGPGAGAAPTRDYTGAWFTAAEPGWGLTVFNFPGQVFALWFVYDSQGRPNWYRMQGAWAGTDVASLALERPTGPAWSNTFNPNSVTWAPVGNATLTFTSATAATLTFNDGTVSRTVTLTKI